jgi:hypothetical protein
VLAVDHARDRHTEGNGCLGVSTCLPSVLSRDRTWASFTERLVYVRPHVDDGLLLLGTYFRHTSSEFMPPGPSHLSYGTALLACLFDASYMSTESTIPSGTVPPPQLPTTAAASAAFVVVGCQKQKSRARRRVRVSQLRVPDSCSQSQFQASGRTAARHLP